MKKDTLNKGKFFWTCPSRPFCTFFLWRDSALPRETGLSPATDAAATADHQQPQLPPAPRTPSFIQPRLTSFGIQVTPGRQARGEDAAAADANRAESGTGGNQETPRTADTSSHRPASDETSRQTKASGGTLMDTAETLGRGTPCPPPSKRKWDALEREHGCDSEWLSDLGSDDERELADMADRSIAKATRRTCDAFATPTPARSAGAGAPLASHVARTLFTGHDGKRQRTLASGEPTSIADGLPTPAKTLMAGTKSRRQPKSPWSSPPDSVTQDPTAQVMTLLRGQNVEPSVLYSVHKLLTASARRNKSILMSRDSARAALGQKEDCIAQLRESVAALQSSDERHSRQITSIKAQLMKMYGDN